MRRNRSNTSGKLVIQGNTTVLQDQPPVLFYNKDEDEPLAAIVVQAVNFMRAGVPHVHILAQEQQYRDMKHLLQLIRSLVVDVLTTSHADELVVTHGWYDNNSYHVFMIERVSDVNREEE